MVEEMFLPSSTVGYTTWEISAGMLGSGLQESSASSAGVGVPAGVSGVNNLFFVTRLVTRFLRTRSLLSILADVAKPVADVADAVADVSAGMSEPDPVRSKKSGVAVFAVIGVITLFPIFGVACGERVVVRIARCRVRRRRRVMVK